MDTVIVLLCYRSRKVTSGVRLKPLERSPTPYAHSTMKKKLKKRRDRKRSSEKSFSGRQNPVLDYHGPKSKSYEYNSQSDSSNDEGFASGRPTSLSGSMSTSTTIASQFTPRLATMREESENDDFVLVDAEFDDDFGKYGESTISLYEEDVQAYLNSEALKDGQVLNQVEESWNMFLQPYVSEVG